MKRLRALEQPRRGRTKNTKNVVIEMSLMVMFFSLVPSGPPQNINCQSRSPNSLLLEWSKPAREERNGIIRGYWLEYYPRTLWYGKSST